MSDEHKLTEAEWHRKQAKDLFNFTWTLIEKAERMPAEDNCSRKIWPPGRGLISPTCSRPEGFGRFYFV
jgi:hypothetical protein